MSIVVELPALGESVVEGEVTRWLVQVGDTVSEDQPLVEVTTDKVDAEIPSPAAGVVVEILAAEGTVVPVGAALARIDADAAAAASPTPTAASAAPQPAAATAPASIEGPKATPVARRVAERAQVDLAAVRGTGAAGRVTKDDVERHVQATPPPAAGPTRMAPPPPATPPVLGAPPAPRAAARRSGKPAFMNYKLQPEDRVIPMSPLRRLVAEHMVLSKRTSPHVGTVAEVDFGGIHRLREVHKREFKDQHGFSLSYLPFIVHATVRALRDFPQLNASVVEDAIVEKQAIHIGIAVETEKGLLVPVVRHADRLSLSGLAGAIDDLAERARTKRLSPDELQGGTFTISNPGREGNLYGFAIINQPQVGILRMGEIVKRPVVRTTGDEDSIAIRPMMYLALSYDHRAVDGAPANGFLYRIRMLIEAADFVL